MGDESECIGKKLAPFNPSGDNVIRMAIEMLQLTDESILYDLGCGDGRLLVEAVKSSGARGSISPSEATKLRTRLQDDIAAALDIVCQVGVEYDKRYADRALTRVTDAELEHRINIVHGNVLDADIEEATAVFVFLVPAGMVALKDGLVSLLRAGAKVVTYVFKVPDLNPVRVEMFKATKLYLYTAASLESPGP